MRFRIALPVLVTLLSFFVLPAAPLSSQQATPVLERVESYTAEGRVHEARVLLERWWDTERPQASRGNLQHALWLRGRLTTDPAMAELDYQRLALEFPGGAYSDQALERLARLAERRGDRTGAEEHYRALLRDYPASPLRGGALEWVERSGSGGALPEGGGTGLPARTERAATPPPEAPVVPVPAVERRTAQADAPASARPLPIAIQLGAFQDREGARQLFERARAAGIEVRLVRVEGSDLVRVRAGGFREREGAELLLSSVRERGFDAFLVTDGERETRMP